MKKKRIMVDMSATILHHGHIRLIKKAAAYGDVVLGLTTDDEILKKKGYEPEIKFNYRKEMLEAIAHVSEVVPTPWLITQEVLDEYAIDLLVHGHDNSNPISEENLLVLPRTEGISSTLIRQNALCSIANINNNKLMLTPGPSVILYENLKHITPVFGRGDSEYQKVSDNVMEWVKGLSGQDKIVAAQGSATFALELAAHTFVSGNILLVVNGYYSSRLEQLLPTNCQVTKMQYVEYLALSANNVSKKFDWVLCAYTETSHAFRIDIELVKEKANSLGAKLYVDSTGSIGLEEHHELCDVTAFSSCKGLFGLTGAAFVAHKKELKPVSTNLFYFNLLTQQEKQVTGPYHALSSLSGVMEIHDQLRERVYQSKKITMKHFSRFIPDSKNQPLLCTYLEGKVISNDDNVVLYSPRSNLPGSVVCHFGEIHKNTIDMTKRISVEAL